MMQNDKDKMHPEDMRNLIIFAVVSILLWTLYEIFVLQPQTEALEKAKKARAELIQEKPDIAEFVPLSREEALGSSVRLPFDNGQIFGSISLRGGHIDDLSLRHCYATLDKKNNVVLFQPEKTEGARYVDYGWVSEDEIALPGETTQWEIDGNRTLGPDAPVTLVWESREGLHFERKISLDKEFGFQITQRVVNLSDRTVTLYPYALAVQTGTPKGYEGRWIMHEGPMGFIDNALVELPYKDMTKEPRRVLEGETGWIGISDKYWMTALVPAQNQRTKYRFKFSPDPVRNAYDRYQTDFTGPPMVLKAGAIENSWHLYAGAKKVLTLEDYQRKWGIKNLDLAVDFGWFWFFTKPFFFALHYLGLLVGNMGIAIIILTVLIRSAVFPLTNISYKSFAKMKVVAPQLHELREKYGNDKEKLQTSVMELYQKEGVNPMSGCLPILVQIPIFFAFYKVLYITIEIRHAPFFGWIQDLSAKDPTSVFNLFGFLPYDVPAVLGIGVWPCLMLLVMLVQKRLNPPPQDKMQRDMMNYFPFIITFVMAGFPSGLVVYWTFSALISVIQQTIIMRRMGVPIYLFEKDKFAEQLEKDLEKGPDVHPLAQMVEDEVEEALLGKDEEDPAPVKPPKSGKKKKKKFPKRV